MTELEIIGMEAAIRSVGLNSRKFPKKLEISLPKAKYPGIYFSIPTDGKSFKLQVYCHQASFAFVDKLNTRGYEFVNADLDRVFSIKEVKGIPSEEEVVDYITEGLETAIHIGIVNAPKIVEKVID